MYWNCWQKSRCPLIISVYLPTRGYKDSIQKFIEVFDRLYEIVQKYQSSHDIIIGGDINENLENEKANEILKHTQDFILESGLKYICAGATYINPKGADCSEIDYFLHSNDLQISPKSVITDLHSNVSDHYPISIRVQRTFTKTCVKKNTSTCASSKVNWDKIDKKKYAETVSNKLNSLNSLFTGANLNAGEVVCKLCDALKGASLSCCPDKNITPPNQS